MASQNTFIFDAVPNTKVGDVKDIAALEVFYKKNGYIPARYINMFLDYLTFYTRQSMVSLENFNTNDFRGVCGVAASVNHQLLSDIGLKSYQFNIGNALCVQKLHQLEIVNIPTIIDGNLTDISFILDPSFRQFCTEELSSYNNYFAPKVKSNSHSAPQPGYFLNLYDEGRKFASEIIEKGYFVMTPENLKMYCDSFALYLKELNDYDDPDLAGKIYQTDTTSQDYSDMISNSILDKLIPAPYPVYTPASIIDKKKRAITYVVNKFFTKKDIYKSDIEDDLEQDFLTK